MRIDAKARDTIFLVAVATVETKETLNFSISPRLSERARRRSFRIVGRHGSDPRGDLNEASRKWGPPGFPATSVQLLNGEVSLPNSRTHQGKIKQSRLGRSNDIFSPAQVRAPCSFLPESLLACARVQHRSWPSRKERLPWSSGCPRTIFSWSRRAVVKAACGASSFPLSIVPLNLPQEKERPNSYPCVKRLLFGKLLRQYDWPHHKSRSSMAR